ncbi:MAG TPA: tetratricopeptide repeat protein [Thermoanaerobaculia bacterium]|nr:tetratricopeptide repeat protein [Thermoanaerobaculia bacterium]
MNHSDDLRHISDCPSCRQRFTENVLPFDAVRRREGAREFLAAAALLERERDGAGDIVERHLRDTPMDEWPRLAESQPLRNNAALEWMSEEVRKRLERNPVEALAIANLAASIAESLLAGTYPAVVLGQIRSTALRDRANALRYLGRLDEAYDSIATAEARLDAFPGAALDRAVVWLVKAMILGQMDLFDDAEAMITAASGIFAEVNDSPRFLQAGLVRGNLLVRQKRYEDAQQVFRDLLSVAISGRDVETQARLQNNLGHCATCLEDYGSASIHFSQAIARFTDLGFTGEVARTERGAGVVLIGKGQIGLGMARLREARQTFAALHMPEEAGLCALRLIEAMVEHGQTDEARALAASVVDEFTAAALDARAIEAVVRLRASLDADGATAEAVRTAHALVQSLTIDQAAAS